MKISSKVNVMRQCSRNKGNNLKHDNDKKSESGPRRVTRALVKTKNINENHPGKLVWGFFSGWWPGKYIRDNDYKVSHTNILHAKCSSHCEYRFHCKN